MSVTEKADAFVLAQYGNLRQFVSKFDKIKINDKNENGSDLLHLSIVGRQYDIALYLLENCIDVNMTNKDEQTALHLIAVNQNLEVANAILVKGGDINIRDKYGNNAMWTAVFNCKGRNYDMVKLFAEYKPDVTTKNKSRQITIEFCPASWK